MNKLMLEKMASIKEKLGLCSSKGCYKRANGDIYIDCIKVRKYLCSKHLLECKELLDKYHIGIDLAPGEDKTVIIEIPYKKEVNKETRKNRVEKQLAKLNYLCKRVKKYRVKKKIRKRIVKLKNRATSIRI